MLFIDITMGPSTRTWLIPGSITLKKTDSFLCNSHQLSNGPQLVVGAHEFSVTIGDWSNFVQVLCNSHICPAFMKNATVLLDPGLFCLVFASFWLLQSFCPLFNSLPWALWGMIVDAPFMTDTYSPHLTSCESLSIAQRLFSDEDWEVH